MTLKIIGTGFGRTGTTSLKIALEMLGFTRCYHMHEVFAHPDHVPHWAAAARGECVDWAQLFDGYQATVDWPAAAVWRDIAAAFPDARFLHTQRDDAAWLKSFARTIRPTLQGPPSGPPGWHAMARALIDDGVFAGACGDDAACLEAYRRQGNTVRAEIPADRLLVFDPTLGWDPLCAFLGVDVPAVAYPHLNTTAEFRTMVGLTDDGGP